MNEIFDIITAVNNLTEHVTFLTTRVNNLSDRVDDLSKYPPLIALSGLMDEATAAKYLHLSIVEMRRIRYSGEIPFKKFHRKILYEVEDISSYLCKTTVAARSRCSTAP